MKSCVEDFAALVRNHEALLKRLLRETRMLSKPIDLADLEKCCAIRRKAPATEGRICMIFRTTQFIE